MGKQSVEDFLGALVHARKAEIETLRGIIRAADPTLGERIKWNAPSYAPGDEDRITFRLQPGERVELIFHRGAAKRAPDGFAFADESGLLKMLTPDRGVVVFADAADVDAKATRLAALVRAWVAATA
jgi:hypothetical protein